MTNWIEINDDARDGSIRRVACDDGATRVGFFEAPHWWYFGGRAMRLPDAGRYHGKDADNLTKVTHFEVPA